MNVNKKILVRLTVLIGLLLAGIIALNLYLHRPSTLTVTSDSDATISLATEQGGKFIELGNGTGVYKTSRLPQTVYVLADKAGAKTLQGVVMERGKNSTVQLQLEKTIPAQKISDGGVLNALIAGTLVQGIVPSDHSITSFRTDTYDVTRPEFINIPYLNKIIWQDKDNFVYQTVDRAVGRFKNGNDFGTDILKNTATGGDLPNPTSDQPDETIEVNDIAQSPGKPLILMSSSYLFTSTDMADHLHVIAQLNRNSKENSLFASDQSIFRVITRVSGDDEVTSAKEPPITVEEYDYSGKLTHTYTLQDESPVVKVTKYQTSIYVLTATNLYTIKDGNTSPEKQGIYFNKASDMTIYKNALIVLGDDGLWKLGDDGVSLHLLYDYSVTGVGLVGSLSVTPDGKLIFGTGPRADNQQTVGAMFLTSF